MVVFLNLSVAQRGKKKDFFKSKINFFQLILTIAGPGNCHSLSGSKSVRSHFWPKNGKPPAGVDRSNRRLPAGQRSCCTRRSQSQVFTSHLQLRPTVEGSNEGSQVFRNEVKKMVVESDLPKKVYPVTKLCFFFAATWSRPLRHRGTASRKTSSFNRLVFEATGEMATSELRTPSA